jgi:hypothetical protein
MQYKSYAELEDENAQLRNRPARSKYNARREVVDGHQFDSRREAARYRELKLLLAAGEIADLIIHPRYPLVVNDYDCGYYEADFAYTVLPGGERIVEDVKGVRTALYRLKKKLVYAIHQITILETR